MPLLLASENVPHRRIVVALQEQVKENIALYSTWNDLYKNFVCTDEFRQVNTKYVQFLKEY